MSTSLLHLSRLRLSAFFLAACAALPAAAADDSYPQRPIRIIVPAVPGGSADAIARIVSEELSKAVGQAVVVENRAGAGMVIGLKALEQAAPDGYTLGIGPRGVLVIGPSVPGGLPFDPRERLLPIAKIASVPIVIASNAATGITTVAELVKAGQSNGAGLSFGSPGQYTSQRIAVEMLAKQTDTQFVHVPYRGGGQAIVDLLSGEIPFASLDLTAVEQHIATGKLNALAVTSARRISLAPRIPTLREAGYAVAPVEPWLGIFAPKDTPPDIAQKLSSILSDLFGRPGAQEKLRKVGLEPAFEPTGQFIATVDNEIREWNTLRARVLPELQQ